MESCTPNSLNQKRLIIGPIVLQHTKIISDILRCLGNLLKNNHYLVTFSWLHHLPLQ